MDLSLLKKQLQQKVGSSHWNGVSLCLLIKDSLLFIKRKEELSSHPGQLAMIGGRRKVHENSPIEVEKREFEEETGLAHNSMEILGILPSVETIRKTVIVPVCNSMDISVRDLKNKIRPNSEWEEGILVSHQRLAQERYWQYAERFNSYSSGVILFYPLLSGEFIPITAPAEEKNNYLLWGATARIVWIFSRLKLN